MRCFLCPGINNCVALDGPMKVGGPLFVGEAPGYDEDKSGRPFVGKTGREVNEHYLPIAGLRREDCTITNAIQCLPDRPGGKLKMSSEKDRALLNYCASFHLYDEIKRLKPNLIIPMGAFACYAIDPDINLELHHGISIQTQWGTTFPMYHPAQGIHEPKKMLLIRNDWIRLRRYLRGNLHITTDLFPNPDYKEATSSDINDMDPGIDMACDTESSRRLGPHFITWSQQPGMGRLIRATNTDLLTKFQAKLDKWQAYIYYHNWPYDWTVTENMGLQFPVKLVRDTMLMVFNLGNLPQGLKVLAYRLLGMEMQDFEDLVTPYSLARIFDYYNLARTFTWPKPEEQTVIDDKTGKWKLYKPQSLSTKLKRLFTDLSNNSDKNLLEVWDNWESHQQELEEKCGPYYGLDIADVPFNEALYYACRDSDATIRLVPILLRMREIAMTGKLQEVWDV